MYTHTACTRTHAYPLYTIRTQVLTQTIWYTHINVQYACKYIHTCMGIETLLTQSADTDAFIIVSHGDWHWGQFIRNTMHFLRLGEQFSLGMFIHCIQHTATAHKNTAHTINNTQLTTPHHTTNTNTINNQLNNTQYSIQYTTTQHTYIYSTCMMPKASHVYIHEEDPHSIFYTSSVS